MKKIVLSLVLSLVACGVMAAEGQCPKSKGECPAKKENCEKGKKDSGCCKDKKGGGTSDQAKK